MAFRVRLANTKAQNGKSILISPWRPAAGAVSAGVTPEREWREAKGHGVVCEPYIIWIPT